MAIKYTDYSKGGKSDFGRRLSKLIQSYRDNAEYANVKEKTICREISSFMSREMNADITVYIDPDLSNNANANIPLLSNNNVFYLDSWIGSQVLGMDDAGKYLSRDNYQKKALLGGFDFRANKFFGWMSETPLHYTLAYDLVYPKVVDGITTDEVTGFLLHETGHSVQMMYGIAYTARANYLLMFAHNNMMGNTNPVFRAELLTEIAGTDKLDILDDINYVSKANDSKLTATVILNAMRTRHRQELGEVARGYGSTGAESLADYYATQHGFGIDCILGLAKISLSPASRRALQASGFLGATSAVTLVSLGLFGGALPAANAMLAMIGMGYSSDNNPYDNPRDRAQRICNTMLENLKASKGEDNRQRIADIKKVQKFIDALPKDSRGLDQIFAEIFLPSGRKGKSARELEKSLEELASHKLILKAERFNNL